MDSRELISIKVGKEKGRVKTDILDKFIEDGKMKLMHRRNDGRYIKTIYEIIKGSEGSKMRIFKSISCTSGDAKGKQNLIQGYKENNKRLEHIKGVVNPLDTREIIDEIGDFIMEITYEYFGDDLLSSMGKENPENIMKYMTLVAQTMKELEKNSISHYDLKPENILVKDEEVKIIDFGISRSFERETQLRKTTIVNGYSELYSPPEVINKQKGHPVKIDVFCWGMSLYQLITKKSIEDLENELKERKKNHQQFLEQIEAIEISGNPDLTRNIREILLCVLNKDYKKRPTFTKLCKLLQDGESEELERIRNLKEQAAKNKEAYKKVKFAYDSIIEGATSCNLHSACIGNAGAELLAFALKDSKNSHLIELDLGFNKIGYESIKELAEALKECHTLKVLILGEGKERKETHPTNYKAEESKENLGNEIQMFCKAIGGATAVSYIIGNTADISSAVAAIATTTATPINVSISITNASAAASAAASATASAIVTSTTGASVNTVTAVAKTVTTASKAAAFTSKVALFAAKATPYLALATIALYVAPLIYKGYKYFTKPPPETVFVGCPEDNKINHLGDKGAKAIADYLRGSKLTSIDLSYCDITSSEAIQCIVEAANACKTLEFINIKKNPGLEGGSFNFRSDLKVEI